MLSIEDDEFERSLPKVGGVALVAYLLAFEGSFGLVADQPLSGPAGDVVGAGLLVLSVLCFVAYFALSFRE